MPSSRTNTPSSATVWLSLRGHPAPRGRVESQVRVRALHDGNRAALAGRSADSEVAHPTPVEAEHRVHEDATHRTEQQTAHRRATCAARTEPSGRIVSEVREAERDRASSHSFAPSSGQSTTGTSRGPYTKTPPGACRRSLHKPTSRSPGTRDRTRETSANSRRTKAGSGELKPCSVASYSVSMLSRTTSYSVVRSGRRRR